MFSDIHFIVPHKNISGYAAILAQENIYCSFTFDTHNSDSNESTFSFLFSEKYKSPFSVTLMFQPNEPISGFNTTWLEQISILLCHSQYLKYNEKPLLGISFPVNVDVTVQHEFEESLLRLSSDMGLEISLAVNNKKSLDNNAPVIITQQDFETTSADQFYNWYLEKLLERESPLKIFLFSEVIDTISEISSLRKKAEQKIIGDFPVIGELLLKVQRVTTKLNDLQSEHSSVSQSLISQKKYLDYLLGRSENNGPGETDLNEVLKIKKYYANEYEILPLWYKRFGHLVKVMLGKRTFRSIFNKNVKKYKN